MSEKRKEKAQLGKQRIETGKIVTTHGIKGEVKIQPWSDSPDFVAALPALYLANGDMLTPERMRCAGSVILAKFKGYENMDQANTLRGKVVYLDRKDVRLPKGQYFICDLEGLSVVDAETGRCYGRLSQVLSTGANDVYEVTDGQGRTYLIPAIPQVIEKTDLEAGILLIRPIEGMFEDAD